MLKWAIFFFCILLNCSFVIDARAKEAIEVDAPRLNAGLEAPKTTPSPTKNEAVSEQYQVDVEAYKMPRLELSDRAVITLDEALHLVTTKSFQARIARATFEKQRFNIDLALSEFKPILTISSGISSVERGGASTLAASSYVSSTKRTFEQLEITKKFPTGQSFSFSENLSRIEASVLGPQAQDIPKSYSATIGFGVSQPLGRGQGREAVTSSLKQAETSFLLEEFRLTYTERQLRYQTYALYYQLASQKKALSVREANFEAARKLLERNYERYKVGLAIRADVLQAENNVLNQKLRLVEAQKAFLNGLEELQLLLGLSYPINIEEDLELIPVAIEIDPEKDWERAKANDLSLKDAETQLRLLEIEHTFRRTELRPDLSLSLDYGRQGEQRSASSALRNLDNQSYNLALNYRLPWQKSQAKARLSQVEKDLEAGKARYEEALQKLRQEWAIAFRELESKKTQVELAKSNVEVARENYQIQIERNNVGLADTLDVIQAQEALLEAELSLVTAQAEYQSAYRKILLMAGLI